MTVPALAIPIPAGVYGLAELVDLGAHDLVGDLLGGRCPRYQGLDGGGLLGRIEHPGLRRPSLAGRILVDPLGELRRALGVSKLAPGEGVAPPMGEVVPDCGPLLPQRVLLEAAVREPSSVFLLLPVPAHQLCTAGISELPYGCRGLEAVLDVELDRSFPLFKGIHAVFQTPSFGTDFRYHPLRTNSK